MTKEEICSILKKLYEGSPDKLVDAETDEELNGHRIEQMVEDTIDEIERKGSQRHLNEDELVFEEF